MESREKCYEKQTYKEYDQEDVEQVQVLLADRTTHPPIHNQGSFGKLWKRERGGGRESLDGCVLERKIVDQAYAVIFRDVQKPCQQDYVNYTTVHTRFNKVIKLRMKHCILRVESTQGSLRLKVVRQV